MSDAVTFLSRISSPVPVKADGSAVDVGSMKRTSSEDSATTRCLTFTRLSDDLNRAGVERDRPTMAGPGDTRGVTLQGVLRAVIVVCCTMLCVSACSHGPKSASSPHGSSASPDFSSGIQGSAPAATAEVAAGDPAWRITRLGPAHAIEGWVDRVSVLPGQAVRLYVSTIDRHWQVTAYRMGWYGGALAHRVWQSGSEPGVRQPKPTRSAATNTVRTPWRPSLTLPTADWPPGAYLLRLDGRTGQRYVPLTIRSPETAGRTVLILPVTTWQAYNDWGGYSLYHGPGGLNDFDNRSVAVSFDRPYTADGASDFVGSQLPLIAHAERLGIPLGVCHRCRSA